MASLSSGARVSQLDRPLMMKPRAEVSLTAFAFLFSEMVQYTQERAQSVSKVLWPGHPGMDPVDLGLG